MSSQIKIRLFGSKKCPDCERIMQDLRSRKISYAFVDAFADHTQELCDKNNVNNLPHIQVIDSSGKVVYEHVGYVSPIKIESVIQTEE